MLFAKYDRYLLVATLSLLVWGLLMVTSSSLEIANQQTGRPFYYMMRQSTYLLLSLGVMGLSVQLPSHFLQRIAVKLLLLTLFCLVLVLIPGIGKVVNGSRRWLQLGPARLQISEFAKFTFVVYLARYLACYPQQVATRLRGFLKPLGLLTVLSFLLLQEPDLGAAIVIIATAFAMLFLAGARLGPFIVLLGSVSLLIVGLMLGSSYRFLRLTSFFNPWHHPFGNGYQLTQSLIAMGRGGWWGVGLGESVQKLFYLPEAHTDFIFAVLVEELGLLGGLLLIGLFTVIIARAFTIAWQCLQSQHLFDAYLAYGIGMNIALGAVINIGVNTGLLPTKGLTLPFISYGGNSLLVSCIMIAILLRIEATLGHTRSKVKCIT